MIVIPFSASISIPLIVTFGISSKHSERKSGQRAARSMQLNNSSNLPLPFAYGILFQAFSLFRNQCFKFFSVLVNKAANGRYRSIGKRANRVAFNHLRNVE